MATKYQILVRILDRIREESAGTKWEKKYAVGSDDSDEVMAARSRSYIHLYLKVMFGLEAFSEREQFLTDGSYDGGIDGFFIDQTNKRIHLLQSKFRNTLRNFEEKSIDHEELLSMDIDRIISGEVTDESGNKYNGKILGLIRMISETPDIARYSYNIVIIANCSIQKENLRKLTGGFNAEIFDFTRAYKELVFPILSGTYFKASEITIQLDLDNKSAGAKTSYSVLTPSYECEITVLFLPAIEIARAMNKYRNSILEYNPRSYLDFDGKSVNAAIRETISRPDSNEFALMNNGLTILSDETNINERIGQRNKAQLRILNPQIINGGQTAYTLSRILSEDPDNSVKLFSGKEVLAKIITLTARSVGPVDTQERRRLIDEISAATNRQTAVITTDRVSNESVHLDLQRLLFTRYGLLYERKRGEFSDGVFASYIDRSDILDRTLFMRLLLTVYGRVGRAVQKKVFATHGLSEAELTDVVALDRFAVSYSLFKFVAPRNTNSAKKYRDALGKVFIGSSMISESGISKEAVERNLNRVWDELVRTASASRSKYAAAYLDRETGQNRRAFSVEKWMNSVDFQRDLKKFVEDQSRQEIPWSVVI